MTATDTDDGDDDNDDAADATTSNGATHEGIETKTRQKRRNIIDDYFNAVTRNAIQLLVFSLF